MYVCMYARMYVYIYVAYVMRVCVVYVRHLGTFVWMERVSALDSVPLVSN